MHKLTDEGGDALADCATRVSSRYFLEEVPIGHAVVLSAGVSLSWFC